jgi:hypothetical protein
MLKSVGIPEYYLGGNVEFLGEAWKNQGLRLAISANTYIQTSFLNLKVFLLSSLMPSRQT